MHKTAKNLGQNTVLNGTILFCKSCISFVLFRLISIIAQITRSECNPMIDCNVEGPTFWQYASDNDAVMEINCLQLLHRDYVLPPGLQETKTIIVFKLAAFEI